MTLYSHLDKLLIDHLKEVADNCKNVISNLNLENKIKSILLDISYLSGSFHDIAKGTKYFQHYLTAQNHEIIGPKSHALLSALFVKEITRIYLETQTELSEFEKKLFSHFAFTTVKRHHGKLDDFEGELYETVEKTKELKQQITALQEEEIQKIIDYFLNDYGLTYSLEDFKNYIKNEQYNDDFGDFYDDYIRFGNFEDLETDARISYFYIHQLLFGTLLLSDKTDVILDKKVVHAKSAISLDNLDNFRYKKGFNIPQKKIDTIKNEAFFSSIQNLVSVFDINQHIYSLTLPTGLGKTITSFGVTLELKKVLNQPFQRLIITIPFTSIIDQNYDVYSEIVGSSDSSVLLKHHHLAEPIYKINDEEFEPSKSEFLIETWQSEIVVTTFVQLLNSIFSNDKSLLMKLPQLANSIIILDEIQTIPYEYWSLIKNSFEVLGKQLNCYFILMSATQPLIFHPEQEIKEIVPNYKKYFGYFNRTKIINRANKKITLNEFTFEVGEYLTKNRQKSILIILNTKRHSKLIFEQLRDIIDFDKEEIYYLSTLITPYERKQIINEIKKDSQKRQIIVSTQLIEAGVDLSVETVFRAIAPIDSIIQAAGRANRYDEKLSQGEVYLYEIEEMMKSTSIIYGSDLIIKTKNVLRDITEIEENNYLNLIEKYFDEVKKQSDAHHSPYLESLQNLEFAKVGKFSLIEELNSESVFIQLNEDAKNVWDEFKKIFENQSLDIFEKKQQFSLIKSKFYDFVINVPLKKGERKIAFDSEKNFGFYLSTLENPSKFYLYDPKSYYDNTGYQEIKNLMY